MDMTPQELSAFRWHSFKRVLRHICKKMQPKDVLEWGPGHSTEVIRQASPKSQILSIEHDVGYFQKAKQRLSPDKNVELVHRVISMKGGHSTGYVTAPLYKSILCHGRVKEMYDLIFVDGRLRFDCLMVAWQLVRRHGIVVLHDSHRQNYHGAVGAYPFVRDFDDIRTTVMSKSSLSVLDDFSDDPVPNTVMSNSDTIDDLLERFESGRPFTYVRFGDADLYFINDPNFSKNKRHDPDPKMSAELKQAFQVDSPDYLIACVAGGEVFSKDGDLKRIAMQYHDGYTYHSAIAFHTMYAKEPDRFVDFVRRAFGDKRVLLIGGESISRNPLVKKVLNATATIEFPDRNAYQVLDQQMPRILKNMDKFDVVISALGQCTRVLGRRIWDAGHRVVYFDVGSTVDALAELPLRSWIKNHSDKVEIYKKIFMEEK